MSFYLGDEGQWINKQYRSGRELELIFNQTVILESKNEQSMTYMLDTLIERKCS